MRIDLLGLARLATLALVTAACGRTGLVIAPPSDASVPPAIDAAPDSGPTTPPPDAGTCDPITCDDGIACTIDRCEGAECVQAPSDALCPAQHTCDPLAGCVTRIVAHDRGTLYEITLPSGDLVEIGPSLRELSDVAIALDGTAYATTETGLARLGLAPTTLVEVAPLRRKVEALDVDQRGPIGAGDGRVARLDPVTGAEAIIATLPPDLASVGDLAVFGDRILVTATTRDERELLLVIDEAAGTTEVVGELGPACVTGLVAAGPILYGVTCEGRILTIEPRDGSTTELRRWKRKFFGAALVARDVGTSPTALLP